MNWREADEYLLDTSGQFRKSVTLLARKGTSVWPLAYIQKPKWMEPTDFAAFTSALEIAVPLERARD